MTILDFVNNQKPMGINDWLSLIAEKGFQAHEQTIIRCADENNKIVVNHDASFKDTVRH